LSAERYGYATLIAHTVNIIFVVFSQAVIVEKANKCLDFTLTILFFHLIGMWLMYGLPGWKMNFWLSQTLIVTVTCLLSEALCMKLETQEIKLTVDDLISASKSSAKSIKDIVTKHTSSGTKNKK